MTAVELPVFLFSGFGGLRPTLSEGKGDVFGSRLSEGSTQGRGQRHARGLLKRSTFFAPIWSREKGPGILKGGGPRATLKAVWAAAQ
ncbi:hypothetical protein SPM24T3_17996 [Serratia sp. M24T3]|nr:hypothetical protein SPM24T3_17996 [Serratia sp. M24T3]